MSLFSLDSFLNLRKFKQYQSEKVQYFLHRLLQVAVNKAGTNTVTLLMNRSNKSTVSALAI